jgi:hypothetical protein
MSKQPATPFTYATYLSDGGKPLLGATESFVFGDPGVRVCEYETSSSTSMDWLGPRQPALPLARRTFEFRLSGSETQEQSVPAAGPEDGSVVVAVNNVRAYLTGSGDAGASLSRISGVEVWAERRDGAVVCCARLSDFAAADLVVVRADVALYRMSA